MSSSPPPSQSTPAPSGNLSADGLETASCLLCGAPPPAPAYTFPPYAVVRCPACDLWYLSPRLNEAAMVAAYREASYFEGGDGPGYSSYVAQESTLRRTFRRLLRDLQRFGMTGASAAGAGGAEGGTAGAGGAGGRLLEVGCAFGFFLDEAKPYFSYRAGTEFSEAGATRARRIADRVYVGGLEEIPDGAHGGQFDTIALIHTIEHVYDPVALLRGLMKHLAPGGWIVLATPHMGGFWRPLLGRLWPFWKPPEHVAFYSAKTLAALLVEAGCGEVRRIPYLSYFPLSLVREKLALKRKAQDEHGGRPEIAVWMPATTVAAAGRKPA